VKHSVAAQQQQQQQHLKVSVDEVTDLKVVVIVAPRIQQGLGHLDPTKVTNEFLQKIVVSVVKPDISKIMGLGSNITFNKRILCILLLN
jgi:hypothetical protein